MDAALAYWLNPILMPDWRGAGVELRSRNEAATAKFEAETAKMMAMEQRSGTEAGQKRFPAQVLWLEDERKKRDKHLRSA